MKFSEMNTDQMAKVLVTIAEPVASIAKDEKVLAVIKDMTKSRKGQPPIVLYADMISGFIPVLLGAHRNDVYAIIAAMTDKSVNEVAAQPGLETVAQIRAFLDADFMSFFTSAAPSNPAK